jgi:hypothetical protein
MPGNERAGQQHGQATATCQQAKHCPIGVRDLACFAAASLSGSGRVANALEIRGGRSRTRGCHRRELQTIPARLTASQGLQNNLPPRPPRPLAGRWRDHPAPPRRSRPQTTARRPPSPAGNRRRWRASHLATRIRDCTEHHRCNLQKALSIPQSIYRGGTTKAVTTPPAPPAPLLGKEGKEQKPTLPSSVLRVSHLLRYAGHPLR